MHRAFGLTQLKDEGDGFGLGGSLFHRDEKSDSGGIAVAEDRVCRMDVFFINWSRR